MTMSIRISSCPTVVQLYPLVATAGVATRRSESATKILRFGIFDPLLYRPTTWLNPVRLYSGPMSDPTTIRRLYGRRSGHKLRRGQAALLEELLPRVGLPAGPLDARLLFGDD